MELSILIKAGTVTTAILVISTTNSSKNWTYKNGNSTLRHIYIGDACNETFSCYLIIALKAVKKYEIIALKFDSLFTFCILTVEN
jgi:hypothetical protein